MAYGEINGWQIEDPAWEGYSKHICTDAHHWYGIYISEFYIDRNRRNRIMVSYPNIAKHFYYVWFDNRDIYFASYSLDEVKRFIKANLPERLWRNKFYCRIRDMVCKQDIDNDMLFKEEK